MKRRDFFKTVGFATIAAGVSTGLNGIACSKKKFTKGSGMKLSYEVKQLNLRHTWTIARNSSNFKQNVTRLRNRQSKLLRKRFLYSLMPILLNLFNWVMIFRIFARGRPPVNVLSTLP